MSKSGLDWLMVGIDKKFFPDGITLLQNDISFMLNFTKKRRTNVGYIVFGFNFSSDKIRTLNLDTDPNSHIIFI